MIASTEVYEIIKEREKLGYKSAKLLFILRMQYLSLEPTDQKIKGSMSM